MDPLISTLGIPDGLAGWKILQNKTAQDYPALTNDPVVKREIAYFTAHAPKALTADALMKDQRLQDFVLTAYGMQSQSGMTALLKKVLNSNVNDPKSFASQMTDVRYKALAADFNYGGPVTPPKPAVASSAEVAIDKLSATSTFAGFSGTFAGITLSDVDLTRATTWQGLADTLQTAFRRADGNRSDIKVTLDGLNLKFTDAKGRGTATSFAFTNNALNTGTGPTASALMNLVAGRKYVAGVGGPAVADDTISAAKKAVTSSAELPVTNLSATSTFASFSGTFAGISLDSVDLTRAASLQGLADTLQTAFRRADGNKTDISVTVDGSNLKFTDTQGRGTAKSFTFANNALNAGPGPAAGALTNVVAGSKAVPASGGGTGTSFIQSVVKKYLNAQFQVVVGNQSNALREAMYAQQQLPKITSWYGVIADRPIADVINTLLGLPQAFGALDVDQQKQVYSQRMNIKDFQDPKKVTALLSRFVGLSALQQNQTGSPNSVAVSLFNTTPVNGIINLTLPSSGGPSGLKTPTSTFSPASAGALLFS